MTELRDNLSLLAEDDPFGIGETRAPPEGRKKKRKSKTRSAEDEFAFQCKTFGLPEPIREYQFAKKATGRQWRFDFAFFSPLDPALDYRVAVEIEGLVVMKVRIGDKMRTVSMGGHAMPSGFREDCVKYATAAMLGWTVIRFEQTQVKDKTAIEYTMRVLAARGWRPG